MIHMKGLISILFFLLFSSQNIAQNISMVEAEIELANLLSELRNAINDEDKNEKNEIVRGDGLDEGNMVYPSHIKYDQTQSAPFSSLLRAASCSADKVAGDAFKNSMPALVTGL